jgi:hypothetical protein
MTGERDSSAAYEEQNDQHQEDLPLNPESQKILYELKKLIDAGDREAVRHFIQKLQVMNRDTGNRRPEKQEGMLWDTVFEYALNVFKVLLPKMFWLKWMVRLDGKFLMIRAIDKAGNQGQQLNVAGLYIFDPPGEKKGRVYLPPTKDGEPDFHKLIMMVSDDCPVRAKRLLINHQQLTELKEKRNK